MKDCLLNKQLKHKIKLKKTLLRDTLCNTHARDLHHDAMDMDLLWNPLDFPKDDHLSTRTHCPALDRLDDRGAPERGDVFEALACLEIELPLF